MGWVQGSADSVARVIAFQPDESSKSLNKLARLFVLKSIILISTCAARRCIPMSSSTDPNPRAFPFDFDASSDIHKRGP